MQNSKWLLAAGLVLACGTAHADIVLYRIPGTNVAFVLQGSVSTNPGKTKLAEGLRAWVKFGTTVTGTGRQCSWWW